MSLSKLPELSIFGACALITLRRPAQKNRLENSDIACLLQTLDDIDTNPAIKVLVIRAELSRENPIFCAGFDLNGFNAQGQALRPFTDLPDRLEKMRCSTVCALNAPVFGGGSDLTLACDFVLATPSASLTMTATKLGLHYYPSGLVRFVRRLGGNAAKQAFLLAKTFSAAELKQFGIITEIYSQIEFETAVQAFIEKLCAMPQQALENTKASLNELAQGEASLSTLQARTAQSEASAEFAAARAQFLQKK